MSNPNKLYLGSMGVPARGGLREAYLGLVGDTEKERTVAIIPNAKDHLPKVEREAFVEEQARLLGKIGMAHVNILDLNMFKDDEDGLNTALDNYGSLWVTGGETYDVLRLMLACKLDSKLHKRLKENSLTYGGYSAGAMAVAASIAGFNLHLCDTPGREDFETEGMGLVDVAVIPHIGNPDFAVLTEGATALLGREVQPLPQGSLSEEVLSEGIVPLTDSQALLHQNGQYTIAQE